MEGGLILAVLTTFIMSAAYLNPCCSGRWSRTYMCKYESRLYTKCLNPYCSGRWSRTLTSEEKIIGRKS